ncbi:unnamed protein product [Rotaria socialis]|uniref:TLC domain-containing protein n=1 Tax=Rotaria socialis TaxID=392032 RepID=A0A818SUI7_9BILA|nr:unnamed protein product [Rotaria socialis]CAF3364126.1 unnamed protein product [Rotaria socialis]CAF3437036.1 unnamed protein product [Rotaria socialis]CAF3675615.1 unnamed protein product [Rotaria socialis]CAF3735227.1 unnamed protein product [Rotaria socialis]
MTTFFYFHETDVFPYRPISPIWSIIYIILSFIFFLIIDLKTKSTAKPKDSHDRNNNWLRQNTLLSFIHSSICSVLIIISVLRAPEMFDDPLSHINYFNYALVAFSLGYFCWDFFDCLQNSTSSTFAILIHHIVVITFLLHILLRSRNIGYALFALSLEINSVFLHARRLLRWYSPMSASANSKKSLKLYIDIGNYITFIIFRFGVVYYGLQQLYVQRHRLDPIVLTFTALSVSAIAILNVVLFYRLIKNQISRKLRTKKDKLIEDNVMMMDNHVILPS